ncbi:MAG: ROK family protein [Candidatus Baldrarchaeia archaeon]
MTRFAIGIDIGATWVRVAIGSEDGELLGRVVEKTSKFPGTDIVRWLADTISALMQKVSVKKISGIGIGSIGPLDIRRGMILTPVNAPLRNVNLVSPLRKKFSVPVYLVNDATAGVIGEKMYGRGEKYENIVYVTLSTGIGGGVYVDGNLLIGKDGNAAEIGHMVIDMEGKLVCGCGKRGHWEAYCSGKNIPNFARYLISRSDEELVKRSLLTKETGGDFSKLTAEMIFRLADKGDELARNIVNEVGRLNAIGFSVLVNMYDPELITIGGAVALKNPKHLVLNPIIENIGEYAINRIPRIEITTLREDVVLLGALGLAMEPPETYLRYIKSD